MKKGNEPAYPCLEHNVSGYGNTVEINIGGQSQYIPFTKGMSIRLKIASEKMDALLGKWNTSLATDTIVRRNPETDKGITGTEDFSESLRVMAKMALMATDTLLKLEEETRNE